MDSRPHGRAGQALRETVRNEYGTTCHLCGRDCSDDFTVDHVVPLALGGSNALDNLRPAHGKATPQCVGNYGRRDRPMPAHAPSRRW